MKAVAQRVSSAAVEVDGVAVGRIGPGLLVYLGVALDDKAPQAVRMAQKVAALRIFNDDQDKLNLSVRDVGGQVLAIPNFTLLGDSRKGNRPAFVAAAGPGLAEELYDAFVGALRGLGCDVETGKFRTHMHITSLADGPVNILLEISAPTQGGSGTR